jgi:hypothetical protein
VDPGQDWIKQHDLLVRVDSVKPGNIPGKGDTQYLVVRLGLMPLTDQVIRLEPFDRDKHAAVLKDEQGRSYNFVAQYHRLRGKAGAPYFVPSTEMREVSGGLRQDLLLFFEPVPARSEMLKLELPASAWGRQGECRFRVPAFFEAPVPTMKK